MLTPSPDGPKRARSHSSLIGCTPFAGLVVALLVPIFLGSAGCGGLDDGADPGAAELEAGVDPSSRAGAAGALEPEIPEGPRRERAALNAQPIPDEHQELIDKLPPAKSGSDEVLFPPGDTDLMEPLVGTKTFSDEAIEIDPYRLMPLDLPIEDEHRAEIYELLVELQPLRLDLTSDHHDRQYILNKRRLEALLQDPRKEVGWAALHAFTNYPGEDFHSRRTLLKVGATLAPGEASPLLEELSFTYGHRMGDRAEALLLLAETDPDALQAGAAPYLERPGRPFQTAPPDEFFTRAWIIAAKAKGESPVPMMATVAMNMAMEPIARYTALDSLAEYADDPLARATLEEALVESTGDGLYRRKAAQGIIAGFPRETACALLMKVLRQEADVNMSRFLDDMIQSNCR